MQAQSGSRNQRVAVTAQEKAAGTAVVSFTRRRPVRAPFAGPSAARAGRRSGSCTRPVCGGRLAKPDGAREIHLPVSRENHSTGGTVVMSPWRSSFAAVKRRSYGICRAEDIEVPDLADGTDQVGVIQLRRDIVVVRLGEEPAETQGLVGTAPMEGDPLTLA
jgi:hypothetical protein